MDTFKEPQYQVVYGPLGDTKSHLVHLSPAPERFTPAIARRAARIACGHDNGVTVTELATGISYRLTASGARKLKDVARGPAYEAAAALGSLGGQSTSAKKAAAARRNGRKGGRPRKRQD